MVSELSGAEPGARVAQQRALAVLRVRNLALALALLPAAVAVVLLAANATERIGGPVWDAVRWTFVLAGIVALAFATVVGALIIRAEPAVSPTVAVPERTAPDLYRLVRELSHRLDVPAPSAIALTPDCDSWLEDRSHATRRLFAAPRPAGGDSTRPPVLVIGSPFLWWMRVAELRAVLAPVVAGTGLSAHPDVAAARRFVRGLDAAVAVAATRSALTLVSWAARTMLRECRDHAAEMERGAASAASARAQTVDYGRRIVAQEQVGLAYAGWDRLLTRVALPAWQMGRWPSRLDAGVVSALTELSRRDRLAEGYASRLGERPACDLLEEPGLVDEAASLLAARLFHGGPAEPGPGWAPVGWDAYPEDVVDRKWRLEAARLHAVLDEITAARASERPPAEGPGAGAESARPGPSVPGPTLDRVMAALAADPATARAEPGAGSRDPSAPDGDDDAYPCREDLVSAAGARVGSAIASRIADEDAAAGRGRSAPSAVAKAGDLDGCVPLFPLQPERTVRELLAEHVTAMVCCAAMDTAGAQPGLDWLDGPVLRLRDGRSAGLGDAVGSLVEDGDAGPLRDWLAGPGVRTDKPVRLV
ncbi:hypothetical protein [Streptomyces meridianus]|uniref:Integral membrane protein n=1 Tax=Streptomyces meridianus TaxID=2938945 RepID=A0ABT0XCZ5_9ACTN|nr:hypothetical protein [Streptomyces meridianus]MCM2580304.1 hypothetical protein [Streptomyces meridianus]